ncbi:MAG: cryptochrome/photolyase family protein [Synechococcales cyanobacterium]
MLGVWILGDQLHPEQAALRSAPNGIPVLLVESHHWVARRNYHQQKLVLVWSAMRHFAQDLRHQGYRVTYEEADTFRDPLLAWIRQEKLQHVWVMQPADLPFRQALQSLAESLPTESSCELHILENNHFLWTSAEFIQWAKPRKRLLMEDFYRQGRKRFGILMDGDQPVGGRWNFDHDNRKTPPAGTTFPPP